MRKKRHNYTPEEKVSILRRHLVENVAISDLCDEYQLQPKLLSVKIVLKSVLMKSRSSSLKPN